MPKKVSGCWNYFLSVIQLRNLFALFDNQSRYIGRIESHTASVVPSWMKKQLASPDREMHWDLKELLTSISSLLCVSDQAAVTLSQIHYSVGINLLSVRWCAQWPASKPDSC